MRLPYHGGLLSAHMQDSPATRPGEVETMIGKWLGPDLSTPARQIRPVEGRTQRWASSGRQGSRLVTRVLIMVQDLQCRSVQALLARAWLTRRIWSSGAADTSASKRYHCCWLDAHMNMLPGRASKQQAEVSRIANRTRTESTLSGLRAC